MLKVLSFDISQIPTTSEPFPNGFGFWGLSLENILIINDFMSERYLTCLSDIDIIWIYGYDFQDKKNKSISEFIHFINSNVKSCKTIIFDLQGEGYYSEWYLKKFDHFRDSLNIKANNHKILWNLNKRVHYKDYDIFYEDFYELVYWYKAKNIKPLYFNNNDNRKYLFNFFNGTLKGRYHRYTLFKKLLNIYDSKIHLISNLDKSTDLPYIHEIQTVNNLKDNSCPKSTSTDEYSRNSYIHIVSESSMDTYHNTFFITEKSIKPFVLQQIPIFLGPTGIVNHFKEYNFDLFDDYIDHSYDNVTDIDLKIDLIYNEIIKLSNLNLPMIFKNEEHRFLHNYKQYENMIKTADIIEHKLKTWVLTV